MLPKKKEKLIRGEPLFTKDRAFPAWHWISAQVYSIMPTCSIYTVIVWPPIGGMDLPIRSRRAIQPSITEMSSLRASSGLAILAGSELASPGQSIDRVASLPRVHGSRSGVRCSCAGPSGPHLFQLSGGSCALSHGRGCPLVAAAWGVGRT